MTQHESKHHAAGLEEAASRIEEAAQVLRDAAAPATTSMSDEPTQRGGSMMTVDRLRALPGDPKQPQAPSGNTGFEYVLKEDPSIALRPDGRRAWMRDGDTWRAIDLEAMLALVKDIGEDAFEAISLSERQRAAARAAEAQKRTTTVFGKSAAKRGDVRKISGTWYKVIGVGRTKTQVLNQDDEDHGLGMAGTRLVSQQVTIRPATEAEVAAHEAQKAEAKNRAPRALVHDLHALAPVEGGDWYGHHPEHLVGGRPTLDKGKLYRIWTDATAKARGWATAAEVVTDGERAWVRRGTGPTWWFPVDPTAAQEIIDRNPDAFEVEDLAERAERRRVAEEARRRAQAEYAEELDEEDRMWEALRARLGTDMTREQLEGLEPPEFDADPEDLYHRYRDLLGTLSAVRDVASSDDAEVEVDPDDSYSEHVKVTFASRAAATEYRRKWLKRLGFTYDREGYWSASIADITDSEYDADDLSRAV